MDVFPSFRKLKAECLRSRTRALLFACIHIARSLRQLPIIEIGRVKLWQTSY